jgi:hypothetical protein
VQKERRRSELTISKGRDTDGTGHNRAAGEAFAVGERKYVVTSVGESAGGVLTVDVGAAFEVGQAAPVALQRAVTVIEGPRVLKAKARLVIDAPAVMKITRPDHHG